MRHVSPPRRALRRFIFRPDAFRRPAVRPAVLLLVLLMLPAGAVHPETRDSRRSYDWYKTQFGTGGTGNCGPACAAMAIYWAKGRDVTVRRIRREIGEPNGSRATSLAHLKQAVERHGVRAESTALRSPEDLRAVIDRGNIAILWIHTGAIRKPPGDVTRTVEGRYYDDECGHYVVLTGYAEPGVEPEEVFGPRVEPEERFEQDVEPEGGGGAVSGDEPGDRSCGAVSGDEPDTEGYFIVHDPIPGDWTTNTVRYPDGSMLGRNRWFPAREVWSSLMKRRVLEIFEQPN